MFACMISPQCSIGLCSIGCIPIRGCPMRPAIFRYAFLFAMAFSVYGFAQSEAAIETIVQVDVSRAANYSIPRSIFGTFLEPIGNSTYNGLWAELLQNPSFEDSLWDVKHVAEMVK